MKKAMRLQLDAGQGHPRLPHYICMIQQAVRLLLMKSNSGVRESTFTALTGKTQICPQIRQRRNMMLWIWQFHCGEQDCYPPRTKQ